MHISGVYPRPPAVSLRDDSDADDAYDAVFRISLYHIPDSASLASSASFWFCVSRNIIIFVSSSSKLQASFHYKRDGGDDGDGLSCIPLPISYKHRHYRHHRHLKQASPHAGRSPAGSQTANPKKLRQYKNPPIPTKQDKIAVPPNSVLVLVKASWPLLFLPANSAKFIHKKRPGGWKVQPSGRSRFLVLGSFWGQSYQMVTIFAIM